MPVEKVKEKKAKKVKAVSMKDLNPDGSLKVLTTQERKAIHEKEMIIKGQKEKAEREKKTAEQNQKIREVRPVPSSPTQYGLYRTDEPTGKRRRPFSPPTADSNRHYPPTIPRAARSACTWSWQI
jgi:hypothetical protein